MTKLIFSTLRGIGLFFSYIRSNMMAVIALSALFLIIHTAFGLGIGMAKFATAATDIDTIRVYLSANSTLDLVKVRSQLEALTDADSIIYFSSEDAKKFVEANINSIEGLNNLSSELFPSFFAVKLLNKYNNIEAMELLANKYKEIVGVEQVSYGQEWARQMVRGKNAILSLLGVFLFLFAVVTVVIIYQTISVTLHKYRKEVRIYNIVGGTSVFIVLPFMVTAGLLGFLCSLISLSGYLIARYVFLLPLEHILNLNLAVSINYIVLFIVITACVSNITGFISAYSFVRTTQRINEE